MAGEKMMSYGDSKNTQQNRDFTSKLKSSLDNDGKIDTDEAKALQESYSKILEQKNQILAISKEDLQKLANGLGLEKGSLGAVLKKLREKSLEAQTAKIEQNIEGLVGQSVVPDQTNVEPKPPVIEGFNGPVGDKGAPGAVEGLNGQSVVPDQTNVEPKPPVIEGFNGPVGGKGDSGSVEGLNGQSVVPEEETDEEETDEEAPKE